MSHFTVMIIGDDIEWKLAPYQENNCWDCPEEYLEFNLEVPEDKIEERAKEIISNKYIQEDEARLKEYQAYIDREDYAGLILEYDGGEYIKWKGIWYWHNPNSKWDWYEIGWRWAGYLQLKPGVKPEAAVNFSWWWDDESKNELLKENRADSALFKDIDFKNKMDKVRARAILYYNFVMSFFPTFDNLVIEKTWLKCFDEVEKLNEGSGKKSNEMKEEVSAMYNAQEKVAEFTRVHSWIRDRYFEEKKSGEIEDPENFLRDFVYDDIGDFQYATAEEYAEDMVNQSISTYAVITDDGEWHSKWEMWWFGLSTETKEEAAEFNKSFYDTFLKDLDPETRITIVDCHV